MNAADRWRSDLLARRIPEPILDAAPESPYGFPAELFRRRAEHAGVAEPTPTSVRTLEALPPEGTVLDVGVGGGATSLPSAGRASRITGVDAQADMLKAFASAARAAGVDADVIQGAWPDVATEAPVCDVAVCGHVLYNTTEIEPFVMSLHEHARNRVVVELTERHPIAWMADLWQRFHGLTWPEGPTADDGLEAIRDLGFDARSERRVSPGDRGGGGFERRQDAIALVRRRLCLPAERDDQIAQALGGRLREHEGRWSTGPPEQAVVTMWWDV